MISLSGSHMTTVVMQINLVVFIKDWEIELYRHIFEHDLWKSYGNTDLAAWQPLSKSELTYAKHTDFFPWNLVKLVCSKYFLLLTKHWYMSYEHSFCESFWAFISHLLDKCYLYIGHSLWQSYRWVGWTYILQPADVIPACHQTWESNTKICLKA